MSASRLHFKEEKKRKKREDKREKRKNKKHKPYYQAPAPAFAIEEGCIPPTHSHKPEFETLWDDVWDDDITQDYWQAQWSGTAHPQEGPAGVQSYDEWADGIRLQFEESMSQKRTAKRQSASGEDEKDRARRRQKERELEQAERERKMAERATRDLDRARDTYRRKWTALKGANACRKLAWSSLPRPVPLGRAVNKDNLAAFLFNGCDFSVEEKKKMVKESLLLWHPDKFVRYKSIFLETDWDRVMEEVNTVSQNLNGIYAEL